MSGGGEDEVADLSLEDCDDGRVGGCDGDVGDAEDDGVGFGVGVGELDFVRAVFGLGDVEGGGACVVHLPSVAVGGEGGDGGEADWGKLEGVEALPEGAGGIIPAGAGKS